DQCTSSSKISNKKGEVDDHSYYDQLSKFVIPNQSFSQPRKTNNVIDILHERSADLDMEIEDDSPVGTPTHVGKTGQIAWSRCYQRHLIPRRSAALSGIDSRERVSSNGERFLRHSMKRSHSQYKQSELSHSEGSKSYYSKSFRRSCSSGSANKILKSQHSHPMSNTMYDYHMGHESSRYSCTSDGLVGEKQDDATDGMIIKSSHNHREYVLIAYISTKQAPLPCISTQFNVISFDDDLKCISELLSIMSKHIYFIVPLLIAKYIVPLIHDHPFLEHIYIYTVNNDTQPSWTKSFSKVRRIWNSILDLDEQVHIDICLGSPDLSYRPTSWATLFHKICSQRPNENAHKYSIFDDDYNKDFEQVTLATLKCNNLVLPKEIQNMFLLKDFHNVDQYEKFVQEENRPVFLITSDECIPSMNKLQALYIWSESRTRFPSQSQHPRTHGTFTDATILYSRLLNDISFYRKAKTSGISFATFPSIDMSQLILPQLNEQMARFLKNYLLSIILPEISELTDSFTHSKIKSLEDIQYCLRVIHGQQIAHLLPNLLELHKRIPNRYNEETISPQTVYHADIISAEDLQTLRQNCDNLINTDSYILVISDLAAVRRLARRIAKSGSSAVLFEIQITQTTKLFYSYDNNSFLFPVGCTFRIRSINQALDGVWYVRLIHTIDKDLQIIKEQLQYEVGHQLNPLIFGHFLSALSWHKEANNYYEFWLDILKSDHRHRYAIHYYYGILLKCAREHRDAVNQLRQALACGKPMIEIAKAHEPWSEEMQESIENSVVDKSIVLGSIADMHYAQNNQKEALQLYETGLVLTVDQRYRRHFQKRIDILKHLLNPSTI
ncbi:unnamed protein product, partial [Adineta ricciae]